MTSETEKVIDAIVKLIRETQEGKIIWSPKEPPASLTLDANTSVDIVYETAYKKRSLRLYEENYLVDPGWLERSTTRAFDEILGTKYPHWASHIMLEITDDKGKTLWTFPEVSGLDDLLESVEYQAAGVKAFLDEIVGDKAS
jgi:hypothetical protein